LPLTPLRKIGHKKNRLAGPAVTEECAEALAKAAAKAGVSIYTLTVRILEDWARGHRGRKKTKL
jgi:hypothetical protein